MTPEEIALVTEMRHEPSAPLTMQQEGWLLVVILCVVVLAVLGIMGAQE